MMELTGEHKTFRWENNILRIPLDFIKIEVVHLPLRRETNMSYGRGEGWRVDITLSNSKTMNYSINKVIYKEIQQWIKNT